MNIPKILNLIVQFDFRLLFSDDNLSFAAGVTLACAAIPAALFSMNIWFFRRPGREWNKRLLPPVSVLIPARNEELSIAAAIESVLSSRGVDLEIIVLDDGSTDRTAEIVRAAAKANPRVRLETAPPLPEGWTGKQHACWVLAGLAKRDVFCFLDADVRVGREAIYHMVSELNYETKKEPEKALVSGFPRQVTGTWLERLLLPLMQLVLLGFLPLAGERWSGASIFAAGCGQFMMVRREPYFLSGGHSANPATMHDGLLLPKLFRSHGFRTSVYDMTRDAACRMYSSAGGVWRGLAKNATEGMASPGRIPIFTIFLFCGQVLPIPVLIWAFQRVAVRPFQMAFFSLLMSYGMRFFCAWRYRQNWRGALLHPVGVLALLVLQWYAFLRKLFRRPAVWKERKYQLG
jgi:glycosyltransferase involved in cell wall biosynthesis